jgi:hypothetical protein
MGLFGRIARWAREAVAWGVAIWHVLGWLGLASLVSGLAISIGGAVWAVIIGIPIPIAAMAAYCTFVGAIYLTFVPAVFRTLGNVQTRSTYQTEPPDYEAWKHIDSYTLNQAAHLWCDIDPDANDTYDTSAWIKVFAAKLRKGELARDKSATMLMITRESLKAFAKKNNYSKRFLKD